MNRKYHYGMLSHTPDISAHLLVTDSEEESEKEEESEREVNQDAEEEEEAVQILDNV